MTKNQIFKNLCCDISAMVTRKQAETQLEKLLKVKLQAAVKKARSEFFSILKEKKGGKIQFLNSAITVPKIKLNKFHRLRQVGKKYYDILLKKELTQKQAEKEILKDRMWQEIFWFKIEKSFTQYSAKMQELFLRVFKKNQAKFRKKLNRKYREMEKILLR